MHRIVFIFYILFFTYLHASEPIMAILRNVNSNDTLVFNIGNYNFVCQPYGIVSIESLYRRSKKESLCKKSIENFYKQNPNLKYIAHRSLYIEQRYHIRFKESLCILYSNGELTFSEVLLKKGVAFLKPKFKDDEFSYRFKESELSAKYNKLGIWGSDIRKSCVTELISR